MTIAKKLFIAAFLFLGMSAVLPAFAGAVDLEDVVVTKELREVSFSKVGDQGDAVSKANSAAIRGVGIFKMMLNGIAVFYVMYIGVMMVISYANEDQISKAKTQIWYAIVAFVFINIPGQIASLFTDKKVTSNVTARVGEGGYSGVEKGCNNVIFCPSSWTDGLGHQVMAFIELGLVAGSVFMFSLAAFKLIANRGDPEDRKAIKMQFMYGGLALVFVGVIEMWVKVVSEADIKTAQSGLFSRLMNLGLLFAGPVAIFFLSWAAYLYITSQGDEDKIKKAKNILVSTFIGTLLLLASYAFLKDLSTFLA